MFSTVFLTLLKRACLALLLAPPLLADGVEAALGVAVGPTRPNAILRSGDNTTALQLRAGWDQSPSQLRMDQWQVMAQSGSSETVRFVMAGLGCQRSWWTERHGAQAALGAELRVERFQGHSSLAGGVSPLASAQAWMVRPWLRAQVGFRGLLTPLPSPAMQTLHWLTQGGRYTHPFTRLEVAVPLWQQGGEGSGGALRQMAPRWEGSLQLGMRFGGLF
ncbi:MAG: hypothetical protein HY014_02270 [Acidobacteria bacterium]|nr:hypothetical protein [Acidobacteriota bacterium]MBI3486974.1 hypothetical protein [Acidobacteriota bacterium]